MDSSQFYTLKIESKLNSSQFYTPYTKNKLNSSQLHTPESQNLNSSQFHTFQKAKNLISLNLLIFFLKILPIILTRNNHTTPSLHIMDYYIKYKNFRLPKGIEVWCGFYVSEKILLMDFISVQINIHFNYIIRFCLLNCIKFQVGKCQNHKSAEHLNNSQRRQTVY